MAQEPNEAAAAEATPPAGPGRSKDEIALELMKFIAVNTGYGKGTTGAGFAAGKATRTPEEHADSLLQLFQRCREAIEK